MSAERDCRDVREYVTDLFGERCEVLSRCERCGEPRYQRPGETGSTMFHAKGCHLNQGSWHVDARAAQDEAGMRDIAQVDRRKREYGGNIERPKDYVGPRRTPTPVGRMRPL